MPQKLINRSRRQWVIGSFVIPAGVPTAKIVEIPERLHPRGPNPANHDRDDALETKQRGLLEKLITDPHSEVTLLDESGAVSNPVLEQAKQDELAALRAQVEKLQRLVAAGGDSEELTAANRELVQKLEAKEQELTTANARIAELEKLVPAKKR